MQLVGCRCYQCQQHSNSATGSTSFSPAALTSEEAYSLRGLLPAASALPSMKNAGSPLAFSRIEKSVPLPKARQPASAPRAACQCTRLRADDINAPTSSAMLYAQIRLILLDAFLPDTERGRRLQSHELAAFQGPFALRTREEPHFARLNLAKIIPLEIRGGK